jgi:hypothetical protein
MPYRIQLTWLSTRPTVKTVRIDPDDRDAGKSCLKLAQPAAVEGMMFGLRPNRQE